MVEIWKELHEYPGTEVSSLGHVKGLKGFRKLFVKKHGYVGVVLTKKQKKKNFLVHRLVAEAFIPNPSNLPQVNHINGIKTDNRVENLEWCTASHNEKHAHSLGLKSQVGENNACSRLTEDDVLNIRHKLSVGEKGRVLSKQYGVTEQTICDIKKRRSWSHI